MVFGSKASNSKQQQPVPPKVYRLPSCQQQLACARGLVSPAIILPAELVGVETFLHVPYRPESLKSRLMSIKPPNGYIFVCVNDFDFCAEYVRLNPGKTEHTQAVWLKFDPEHGKGLSALKSIEKSDANNFMASEIFSLLTYAPELVVELLKDGLTILLAGYQMKSHGQWENVPGLYMIGSEIHLGVFRANVSSPCWASPTVRKL